MIAAVNRLRSDFRLLLVGKVLESVASTTSELQVAGEIFSVSGVGSPVSFSRQGSARRGGVIQSIASGTEPFRSGDRIQVKIENREDQDLYLGCLVIDGFNNLITLYSVDFESPEEASRIERGKDLTVPRPEDDWEFPTSSSGYIQLLTLVSTQPLRNVLRGLQSIARSRGTSRSFLTAVID